MPANVESMFYRQDVPWHGLGTRVDDYLTAEDAIVAADLDWNVDQRPVYTVDRDGNGMQLFDKWATVRASDDKPLGIVGDIYTVVQNREAFSFVDELVGSDAAKYETAGSLHDGKVVWMLAKLNAAMQVGPDKLDSYLFLQNRHDGKGALVCGLTTVRIVCQNTLQAALRGATNTWYFRHATNISERIEAAKETMRLSVDAQEAFKRAASELVTRSFTKDDFVKVSADLYPVAATGDGSSIKDRNNEQRRQELLATWLKSPNLEDVRMTAWGAWNGIVEWLDHGKTYTDDERRFYSLMSGNGASSKMKQKALSLVVKQSGADVKVDLRARAGAL